MLTHPTLDRLNALGLHGMANAFVDIEATGEAASLGHAEWLALLLEREASLRHDKRLATRLRYAKLRQQACVEDIDYRTPRGLDRLATLHPGGGRQSQDRQTVAAPIRHVRHCHRPRARRGGHCERRTPRS